MAGTAVEVNFPVYGSGVPEPVPQATSRLGSPLVTRTLIAALTAALIALGLAAAPASAATRNIPDPVDSQRPSSYDLRSTKIDNGRRYISFVASVRNLRRVPFTLQAEFSVGPQRQSGQQFVALTSQDRGEPKVTALQYENENGDRDPIRCRGVRSSFDFSRDRVTLKVPQFCLGEGVGRQKVQVLTGVPSSGFDRSKPVFVARN